MSWARRLRGRQAPAGGCPAARHTLRREEPRPARGVRRLLGQEQASAMHAAWEAGRAVVEEQPASHGAEQRLAVQREGRRLSPGLPRRGSGIAP